MNRSLHIEMVDDERRISTPERNLLCAVIVQAFEDATRKLRSTQNSSDKARWKEDALRWLASSSTEPWSFRRCCVHLDVDPSYLLAGMLDAVVKRESGP